MHIANPISIKLSEIPRQLVRIVADKRDPHARPFLRAYLEHLSHWWTGRIWHMHAENPARVKLTIAQCILVDGETWLDVEPVLIEEGWRSGSLAECRLYASLSEQADMRSTALPGVRYRDDDLRERVSVAQVIKRFSERVLRIWTRPHTWLEKMSAGNIILISKVEMLDG